MAVPQTPQRPLPGAFAATPAPAPTIFSANAATLRQTIAPPSADSSNVTSTSTQSMSSVERAARTVNDALLQEARFPDLEGYITQGISGDYEMPSNAAWMPYQVLKQYDLPTKILEQANHSGVGMLMGIFAPLGHAWVALDNCLYLWDYSTPNPEIIGWEENANPITAIKLVTPKPGVFIGDIEHLIVVVTNVDMILLGVATQKTPTGGKTVALYNTRMSIKIQGHAVTVVEFSKKTGRIFFASAHSDNINEFHYQQEEGWFRGRTEFRRYGQASFAQDSMKAIGQFFGPQQAKKTIHQLVVDDTRDLLYSLSNTSEIKVWAIRNELQQAIMRPLSALLQNTGHFSPRTDLLYGNDVSLTSISAIPVTEAARLSLMAVTNTGCRLYMSVTRGFGLSADGSNAPNSMQILHIRFPPKDPSAISSASPSQQNQSSMVPYGNASQNVDSSSRLLTPTDVGYRIPPGYFMTFMQDKNRPGKDKMFCSAPDSARLKNPQDTSQLNQRFSEFAMFVELPGTFQQMTPLNSDDFGATKTPVGFGNELAIQFDRPNAEIAIVTSAAIQTIRRRRLVDMFAGMMRYGSSDDEGREGDIKRFVRTYGRGETAATALAVACGQGMDVTSDSRLTEITDPEVIEGARRAFLEHGGKPEYNANALPDNSGSQLDNVRPSPRHEGLTLYVSRLVRSIWKASIIKEDAAPGQGSKLVPNIDVTKLRSVQGLLDSLSKFLDRNKSFIEGLAGPQPLNRVTSRQEEIAMQAEHRAMHSMMKLIASIIEGISFVLVLFDERLDVILAALGEDSRRRAKELTFEGLFVSSVGRELAKELVKAIVNSNIASGSNVDTVAEALRRKCGSFCSADDVVIFKAQEQVKRASEAGSQSETGRALLNESQRLFQRVAESLSMEHLQWATDQYVQMAFYAGAIQLCLVVAAQRDRAKRALSWLKDGMPHGDSRQEAFDARKRCYDLIFETIQVLDQATAQSPARTDGQYTLAAKRCNEAYDVINGSDDAVFQTCLFDWYVNIGQADRLLDIDTKYVVEYLTRRSQNDRAHADLLWRYYAHHNDYLQAAQVQLDLAKGYFDLTLEERIEYLSRARTNASTRQTALTDSRQSKQQLLRDISDLLDVANIQDDIYQRMRSDGRLNPERREQVLHNLNGHIMDIAELFNQYADQAGYYDICILIYQVADHRNPADIKASWQGLIDQTDEQSQALYGRQAAPWESVGEKVRELGRRLSVNDATFPIQTLLPMLERYYMRPQEHNPPQQWVLDLFLDLDIPHETLMPVLEQLYYGNVQPFVGGRRRILAGQMVYLLRSWFQESERKGERVIFGSEENASLVLVSLASLLRGGDLDAAATNEAENLVSFVQRAMR